MNIRDEYISTKCIEIENLLKDCRDWALNDPKLGAHLATYANVLILGMLEECFEHIVKERAKKSGDVEVENYIGKHIEQRFRNPNFGLICSILGQFSDTYREEFEKTFKTDSPEVVAINGLLENKTNVAHYGVANLNLSINDVEIYFSGVVNILVKLEDMLL
ncbi:MAG: hypothetical protein DRI01_05110 [Chloroflexi bacterium]|nr:MAG: hypothetical protein DRI01_05110 [Chloroflexota bacterium]